MMRNESRIHKIKNLLSYGLENGFESQETNYNRLLVNNSDIAAGPQFRHLVSV